jgi:tetratricopeptide (TPR) repeat protein
MAYEQQGDLAAALEAYEAVVALAPARNVERQKASLLRLRLGEHPELHAKPARPAGPVIPHLDRLKALISTNPPLYAGLGSGLLIFLLGTILLVNANRAQAARAVEAEYAQELQVGDQALANQQYAEASVHYAAAWRLRQDDGTLRARWEQAYQLSVAQQSSPMAQIAQMPKYIPNLTGRNPFDPVPIGGTGVALPPGMVQGDPAAQAVPPPTVNPERPPTPYQTETVKESARQVAVPPPTIPGGRSTRQSPFSNPPISPVPDKNIGKPAATAPPATVDTAKPSKNGEITIWVSDKPATKPPATSAPSNNADSLRSRGDAAAREGRNDEAIDNWSRAAAAFDDRARQDPSAAAISRQNANSCRYSIEVLRNKR